MIYSRNMMCNTILYDTCHEMGYVSSEEYVAPNSHKNINIISTTLWGGNHILPRTAHLTR